jgi:hypothetical protein
MSTEMVRYSIRQCGTAGGPRATSDPRPFLTRFSKLFVYLLLVTTNFDDVNDNDGNGLIFL